ncbi:hypothetical protein BRADI_2g53200v3 [Brachypodium distachyon]|uniref:Uncharacterized protein n=1 Tax=Brachypodium distachyon TaxID=15368 RepID=I1HSR9_BRADI|nr:hypothetical protein BRADI_2g53200v3 [Brachypodium distachyon]
MAEYGRSCSQKRKPVLALLVSLLACLLLLAPLVSSVPLSRSVSLGNNHQASPSALEVPVQVQGVVTAAERSNLGEAAARMDIEVNDYPGSGANNRHDPPRSPGRG